MPNHQLGWDEVRDVLVKRRKAGQAPHWSIGWAAARIARGENAVVNAAYKHVVLDYYQANAERDEDTIKIRTWHRLIGFIDGLHNATVEDAESETPAPSDATQLS
jgi:hypothetical protein